MQLHMQVITSPGGSLRRRIEEDLQASDHGLLYLDRARKPGRNPGWAKVKAHGVSGVVNFEWEARQHMLMVHAVAKGGNKPYQIIGLFIEYLLAKHRRRILSINIQRVWRERTP